MGNYTDKPTGNPALEDFPSALEQALHKGAQAMLQLAIELEVQQYIEKYQQALDEKGHRLVVRNGYLPERDLLTGLGPVTVKQPRVDDRKLRERHKEAEGFTSAILPRYLRRSFSNMASMIRMNLFTYRDLDEWLNEPYATPPLIPEPEQLRLALR